MRLAYESLTAAHAAPLLAALSDPAVYRYIDDEPPASVEDLAARFERMSSGPPTHRAQEEWWNFAVRRIDTGEGIGRLEATILQDRAEIAYLFGVASWGKGYATEAVRWLQRRIGTHTAVTTLWATARPDNARSLALLNRLGYVPVSAWPHLTSYDPGDAVYRKAIDTADDAS